MFSEAFEQLRRDVSTVFSSVLGHPPPPLVTRPARRERPSYTSTTSAALGRPLVIDEVVRETDDMVSLVLADPSGKPIDFAPGQFFTLVVPVDGVLLRRAYSASSRPGELGGRVRVSVKRIPGGKVSEKLVGSARAGQRLTVLGPSGSFGPSASEGPRHLVLVAGGSGITPMMSIAETWLEREPHTSIDLVFGNRSERDIPFRDELAALERAHGTRFHVTHVLSEPNEGHDGLRGLLSGDVLARALEGRPRADEHYLCGPEPMRVEARRHFRERGVHDARIFEEVFASPKTKSAAADVPVEVTVLVRGEKKRALQQVGKTLLEAGLAAGIDMPYSCAMGGCGACKVHVVSGETTEDGAALTAAERAAGYALACTDRATGPCTLEIPR